MDTRHLVDDELLPMLELFGTLDLSAQPLEQIRAESGQRFAMLPPPPIPADVRLADGPAGPLEIYWYDRAPGTKDRPALLHIHGGGMVLGAAREMQHSPSGLAAALGIPVASVEYRLAPEHPFPAPQEDCLAALTWLAGNAIELGIDAHRIGVIGESAGGGLAASVAQMARDLGEPALAAQFLIYPMLDHRTGGPTCPYRNRATGEFIWTRASNRFGWEALRGDYVPTDARKGWFSPALVDDLAELAPAWIGTGTLDLFFDEDLDYARRLADAGVPVELHSYPGAIHAFNVMAESRLAQAFNRDLLSAIANMLGPLPQHLTEDDF